MDYEAVRKAALARLGEFTDRTPSGRAVPYRRIAVREAELFAIAAKENQEYAGVSAIGAIDEDGAADIRGIAAPLPVPELLTKIIVATLTDDADPEELSFAVGDEVTIVSIADRDGVAPRATLRDGVLRGVDEDFAFVEEVEVFYPYRPDPAAADEDGTRAVQLVDPYDELLVIDLAREYIRKAMTLDKTTRGEVVALLDAEEARMVPNFLAHVRTFAPVQGRFARESQSRRNT